VIDHSAFLAQLQIDHAGAVPAMAVCERHDAIAQTGIGIWPRDISERSRAHAYDRQRVPLTEALPDHLAHHLPSSRCGHHIFRSTSRVTSISGWDSASNFFNRAFSISSSFRRLASDTLIPPNFLRQR
jgi:hypothetical protein